MQSANMSPNSGSTKPTGVIRLVGAASNLVPGAGVVNSVANATTEVGKAFGALDWTKVRSNTTSAETARALQFSVPGTPTPPPQQNQMAAMLASSLGPLTSMLSGLQGLRKGDRKNKKKGNSNNSTNPSVSPQPPFQNKPPQTAQKPPEQTAETAKPPKEEKATN